LVGDLFSELADRLRQDEAKLQSISKAQDPSIWKETPVDFISFCRDFIGEPLFTGPQEDVARDVIGFISPERFWDTTFQIVLLAWGKSSGKGALSAKLISYCGYLLKMMKNPRQFFRIGNTAPIHIINISYNSFQAKTVFFQGYLIPTILNTINPKTGKNFFEENGMDLRVNEGDILAGMIRFERPTTKGEGGIMAVSLAGDKGTAEGFSPLCIFVDELSAMQNPKKAQDLVDDLEKSAVSRFGDYYKLILASFKRGKNCLMSLKVQEAEEKNLPNVYISRKSTWEVNRMKTEKEFSKQYESNPVKAARTFEFKEVEGQDDNVFLKLFDRLQDAFVEHDANPFVGNVVYCRTDQLKILEFKEWFKPIPTAKYFVHIDLAKGTGKDRAGFVMVHKEGLDTLTQADLRKYLEGDVLDKNFKVKADIILQLRASTSGEIILEEIRKFVIKLKNMGYRVAVTLDGYQSLDTLQLLKNAGIEAELLSVDRDRKGYDSLQSLIYRRNLDLYEHPILLRELSELEESDDGKKVDHPEFSLARVKEDGIKFATKDVCDALAGSCLKAIQSPEPSIPLMPTLGLKPTQQELEAQDYIDFDESEFGGLIQVNRNNPPRQKFNGLMPLIG
jgi:hypothetical protein